MIIINTYLAWFSVITDHGCNLEFVLDDAEDRTSIDYVDTLKEMLNAEFKSVEHVKVEDVQVYYDVSFLISAESPGVLEWALGKSETVVNHWITKYRINSMKRIAKRA